MVGGMIEEALNRMTYKEIIDRLHYLIDEAEARMIEARIMFWELEKRAGIKR